MVGGYIHTDRKADIQTYKHTYSQPYREIETVRHTGHAYRERYRQAGSQADKKADRQARTYIYIY